MFIKKMEGKRHKDQIFNEIYVVCVCVLAFLFGAGDRSAGVKRREIDYKLKFERGIDFGGFSFARVATSGCRNKRKKPRD